MVQVIKGKYFKNGDVLHQHIEAKNGSYTWNGITKGMHIIRDNYFMKINNGVKTRIWLDRWIPGMNEPPSSASDLYRFYEFVYELFITNSNTWNVTHLNQLFDNETSNMIQKLYINLNKEDELIWIPAKNGVFLVKSTYNMLTKSRYQVEVNGNIVSASTWKKLWGCNIAHRIKLFSWKCLRNLNSTRSKLVIYDAEIDTRCGVCGMGEETLEHLLLECPHARKVWREVNIDIDAVTSRFDRVSNWVYWFSSGSYGIDEKWLPPVKGVLKFNIDASFDHNTNELGTAVVLRDHTRHCKGIRGKYADGILNAEMGECMAIREALSWAKRMQYTSIQVEADAELVIQTINGVSLLIPWENRNLIKEIKQLSLNFTHCSFSFTKRDNNQIADYISRTVRETTNGIEVDGEFSTAICDLLAKDQENILN
ncbi:uncharacterized protein LOC113351423 [Papaver somniferum]|uniref:uncharacterized protein LOC113351423 n=1 Tax=Papaver somniferum TaxID=3469 RepID=UPI000E702063|nr:uncharacterized protein LOC113351423 [Papaver somniferum]